MNNNSNYNGLFAKLIEKANERMDKVNGTVNGELAKKIRKKNPPTRLAVPAKIPIFAEPNNKQHHEPLTAV